MRCIRQRVINNLDTCRNGGCGLPVTTVVQSSLTVFSYVRRPGRATHRGTGGEDAQDHGLGQGALGLFLEAAELRAQLGSSQPVQGRKGGREAQRRGKGA